MNKQFSNQNHAIHRSHDPLKKIASVYDKQSISNRIVEEKRLSFASLSPSEEQAIISTMEKEASELEEFELTKNASPFSSPLDLFSHAKNYIASKLGLSDGVAHDLSSSVIAKAGDIANTHGMDIAQAVTGIVDNMDRKEIQNRTGAVPMKAQSRADLQETIKVKLMDSLHLSSFDADRVKMNVIQQARNLSTTYRNVDIARIADAIIDVMIDYHDVSVVYDISTSDRLSKEVKFHLDQNIG